MESFYVELKILGGFEGQYLGNSSARVNRK